MAPPLARSVARDFQDAPSLRFGGSGTQAMLRGMAAAPPGRTHSKSCAQLGTSALAIAAPRGWDNLSYS